MRRRSLRELVHQALQVGRSGRQGSRPGRLARGHATGRQLAVERLEDRYLLSTLQAISLPPANQPPSDTAAGASTSPTVSDDGRYIAFQSAAPNLVPGQTGGPGNTNVFLLDRGSGGITLVSHLPGSATAASATMLSVDPILSGNGRYVVYRSFDPNSANTNNGVVIYQLEIYDRTTGQNTLLTPPANFTTDYFAQVMAISTDGRYVLYTSATVPNRNIQLLLFDQQAQATYLVTHAFGQNDVPVVATFAGSTQISAAGGIFTLRMGASVADNGTVAYVSNASNLVNPGTMKRNNVYLYDPASQANRLISTASGSPTTDAGGCGSPLVSRDGSTVVFVSTATDLVANQSGAAQNVFRYQVSGGTTALLSGRGGSATASGNGDSGGNLDSPPLAGYEMAVSANGQFVAFASHATDLIAGQAGAADNVFLYNAQVPSLTLVSGVAGSATVGAGGVTDYFAIDSFSGQTVLSLSADGSRVAYVSQAPNIVAGQTGPADIDNVFVYNSGPGLTSLVTGANGSATATGNAPAGFPFVCGNGSVVAFAAVASNLNAGLFDGNGTADVFAATPGAGAPAVLSRAAFAQAASGPSFSTSVSADGRYTVLTSTADLVPNQVIENLNQNIFLYDKQTGSLALVNHLPGLPATTGNHGVVAPTNARLPRALQPVISADGRFVAFTSGDTDLVPNETGQNLIPPASSLYLYDVSSGQIMLVSGYGGSSTDAGILGGLDPVISADGSYLAYVDSGGAAYLYNRATGTSTFINSRPSPPFGGGPQPGPQQNGSASDLSMSDDGRYVVYLDSVAVYLFDRASGSNTLVDRFSGSSLSTGYSVAPVISHNGSFVAYVSSLNSEPVSSVYLYNVAAGTHSLLSGLNGSLTLVSNGNSDSPAISGDGTYVAYRSDATNLVNGQAGPAGSNIFEFNTQTRTPTLVSAQAGTPLTAAAGNSDTPVIDDDGHLVSYVSTAGNLIPGQTGPAGVKNVFIWLRQTDGNILASGQNGSPTATGNADSDGPLLTRHSFPGFSSTASNLVAGVGGTSVAYLNTLVELALSPNTVYNLSPSGTIVGTLSVSSLLVGQYLPPTYGLPTAEADNAAFHLATGAGGETLATGFQANYASRQSYQVTVHVDVGFGDDVGTLTVFVALATQPVPAPTHLLDVAAALTTSAEYLSNIITAAYQRYLGRGPEPAGLAFWLDQYGSHGLTDEHLEAGFIGSAEYIANHGGPGAGWVAGMYHDLLGRSPAQAEVDGWLRVLAGGVTTVAVAYGFAASGEREGQRVGADYQRYLGRTPEAAEVGYWVDQFLTHGLTNEHVVAGFIASFEFYGNHRSDPRDWLFAAYQAALGRDPDPAGLHSWLGVLQGP